MNPLFFDFLAWFCEHLVHAKWRGGGVMNFYGAYDQGLY